MKGKLRGQRDSMTGERKTRKISRHAGEREAQNPAARRSQAFPQASMIF